MLPSPDFVFAKSLEAEIKTLTSTPEFKIFLILNNGETITVRAPITSIISERFLGRFTVKNIEGNVIIDIPVENITAKIISVE